MSSYRALFDLPPILTSPAIARRVVEQALTAWSASQLLDAAQLVVSEMVTNAVNHAGGPATLELTVELHDDELLLALADGSSIRPLARELVDDSPSGRGIHLIEAVADRWDVRDYHGGKQVRVILRQPLEATPDHS